MAGSRVRLIDIVRPFYSLVPQVESPLRRVFFNDKLVNTVLAVLFLLVAGEIRIFGIQKTDRIDPLYWMRPMLASKMGTLMEIGVQPVISASMLMQLLYGLRLIDMDYRSRQDRNLFQGLQKLFAIFLYFIWATGSLLAGAYGDIEEIGYVKSALIVAQLMFGGTLVVLLDDMLNKGWGLGNGTMAFVGTNICGAVLIKAVGFTSVQTSSGSEYEGAIINLLYSVFSGSDRLWALQNAFFRNQAPNIVGVLATVAIIGIMIFVQSYRVQIYVSAKKARGHKQPFPIRLLYVNSIPILIHTAVLANYYFLCYLVQSFMGKNFVTTIVGRWSGLDGAGNSHLESGLGYFLSPPRTLWELLTDPIHTAFYVSLVLYTYAVICRIWIEVNGTSPRDVAKQLQENEMTIEGMRDGGAVVKHLSRYINVASLFGGVVIGVLSVSAHFTGALGSGTGIVLGVTVVY